ncbi:MAG: glycoside hydrolase [Oscillospiraceae bacterium]|nr:glycoside hydrolase [Oscillospiraceae bacterium]
MAKKRLTSGVMAAAMAMNCFVAMPLNVCAVDSVRYEAEDATIAGVGEKATEVTGYSGTGYVNLTDNEQSPLPSVTFTVNVEEAGNYGLTIGYATVYGAKHMDIEVNGNVLDSVALDASDNFTEMTLKAPLKAGENTVKLTASWGWMQIDYIEIGDYKAPERPEIVATQTAPCDKNATDSARQLMTYLSSVYGKHILSGQQEIYMNGPHDVEQEFNYIQEKTGKLPAIRGFDYGNFTCPAFGSDDGSTQRMIEWAKKGGICTVSFHLNVPTDFASYTIGDRIDWGQTTYSEKTDFSPEKAATPGTKENQYYLQALDTLAEEFSKVQDLNIPILFRPLHEAEGGGGESGSWFWWGREGSKAYRQLWLYTYQYLTEEKGIHNLIWEWNSYDFSTSANWYPGDEYVDIIGYDKYNCTVYNADGSATVVHNDSAIPDIFYSIMNRYNNTKMVAMAECDSFSTLENLTTEKAGWLYFLPWYDGGSDDINFLSNPKFNTEEDLITLYQSDYCITLDELPKFGDIVIDPDATNTPVNTQPTEPDAGHAIISEDSKTGNFKIDLPEAAETIYLVVDLADGITYANGGLGVSIEIDGNYYWANVQWEATKSGAIELTLADKLYNVTLENEEVTDEAIIEAVKKALGQQKSFEGQIWYAGAGEDAADTSGVKITDAYIKTTGTTDPIEPTTDPSTAPTDAEDITSTKKGDVNGDGFVDILDIIVTNKTILSQRTLLPQQFKNADIDNNNMITPEDSLAIMRAIVGLEALPA